MNWKASGQLLRPSHWIKNVMVLLPVLFALRIADGWAWLRASLAGGAFCLLSSAVYILNDLRDRDRDRLHPAKAHRPLARGAVGVGQAQVLFAVSLVGALLVWAPLLWVGPDRSASLGVLIVLGAYLLLQIAYSYRLKRVLILDVVCIAMGFVLRALAGAVAIQVEISPWLFVMAFTLCLFMGFCKRYNEQAVLDDRDAVGHRDTLAGYDRQLLTHLVTLSASTAVMGMILYSLDQRTIEHFGTNYLVYTLPVFLYGVFRFAMLSMAGSYSGPTDLILRDRPFQLTVVLWMLAAAGVIYWGPELTTSLGAAGR